MKVKAFLLFVLICGVLHAEDGASLRVLQVQRLPDEAIVTSYDILSTESTSRLVTEMRTADGAVSFYTFDSVDGALSARPCDASTLPVRFTDPPIGESVARTLMGRPANEKYWAVTREHSPQMHTEYVTEIPLAARRFADVSGAIYAELPPVEAGLAVEYLVVGPAGDVLSTCVLEPNLIRRGERMAPVFAEWVLSQGNPHLLVGMAVDAGDQPWPLFFRLYSASFEIVCQSEVVTSIEPNRFPRPVVVDLTGDGAEEVVVLSTSAAGPALAVVQTGAGDPRGHRILALNSCSTRMNGEDVVMVQRELERRGYDCGRFGQDGWYGPDTRAAVVAFQRDSGTLVSGVVDAATWSLLGIR